MDNSLPNRAIQWQQSHLRLLDQRRLPGEVVFIDCYQADEVGQAITDMVVRGAPAIGISAAYGVVLSVMQRLQTAGADWWPQVQEDMQRLKEARPTAVNLGWAVDQMEKVLARAQAHNAVTLASTCAAEIHARDVESNRQMGLLGAGYIQAPSQIMTHCNAGALATGGIGTALGVVRAAHAAGNIINVFANETRPWFQGSRLTAWELKQDHIPVTVTCDSAAATVLREGRVSWVIVGADRIVANGDVANKIGTYSLAVSARFHGVKFMVVAPTSTIDPGTASGEDIPIEERSVKEILHYGDLAIGAAGVSAFNPVFDVTPAHLVDLLVTEKGVIEQPDEEKIRRLLA